MTADAGRISVDVRSRDMQINPQTDDSTRPSRSKLFVEKAIAYRKFLQEHCPHLSEERQHELTKLFLDATDPDKPVPYKLRPAGESFHTWWRREYCERKYIGKSRLLDRTTYSELRAADPEGARAYETARDDLPADMRMPLGRRGRPWPKKREPS